MVGGSFKPGSEVNVAEDFSALGSLRRVREAKFPDLPDYGHFGL